MTTLVVALVMSAAVVVAAPRWLRVAQREHYLPWSVVRFAWRWLRAEPLTAVLAAVALVAGVVALAVPRTSPVDAIVAGAVLAGLPRGLTLRGVTSPLRWTDRLRRVAAVAAVSWLVVVGLGVVAGPGVIILGGLALPAIVDLALVVLSPIERRMGDRWVARAAERIATVSPRVVAITGSYGKTTTKEYVRSLVGSQMQTLASPASFNNRMGLARAVNEHLTDGIDVFVAEMGTYGPGEIRDLCSWVPPDIAVITAIGPVHLERFGSLDVTLASKSEILERASAAVLNIDDPRLAGIVPGLEIDVVTVSATGADADVRMTPTDGGYRLTVHGRDLGVVPDVPLASNFACAVGVAVALGADLSGVAQAAESVQLPAHRQSQYVGEGGFTIIDDTYNSNPAGAAAALAALGAAGPGRKVVVTPGMVELGPIQHDENRAFGAAAAQVADDVIIVGATNRTALLEGTASGGASVMLVKSRAEAVAWVKANLKPGDAVLYENDLPDHYP